MKNPEDRTAPTVEVIDTVGDLYRAQAVAQAVERIIESADLLDEVVVRVSVLKHAVAKAKAASEVRG